MITQLLVHGKKYAMFCIIFNEFYLSEEEILWTKESKTKDLR